MNVLSLNPGSSSLKFGLFDGDRAVFRGSGGDISGAIAEAQARGRVDMVACRVVHGGARFEEATRVDDGVLAEIEALAPLAPLHNAADLRAIQAAREALPDVPVYAVFDTAFHRTLPPVAFSYAVPPELGIRRYGFHGISYAHVASVLSGCSRLVACHLGSGASVCAILNGKSVDTSMGLTPLEGLAMGTRSGDLDPGAVLYLMRERGMSRETVDDLLNHRSGLSGLSGLSADIRELLTSTDVRARLALDVFVYRVVKYVGAYAAAMGGLDGLAFTGGIGEHSPEVRRRVCERLGFLGLLLDENGDSKGEVPVWVVAADEEAQMALEVRLRNA